MSNHDASVEELIQRAKRGGLSRRQFSALLGATGVSLFAMPVGSRMANAADGQAMYFTWGGYDIPELLQEYYEKHGALPDMAPYASESEALMRVQAGFVVDVMHPCNATIPRWIREGVLQPIDTSRLSHWNDMIPSLQEIGKHEGEHYFASTEWGQTSFVYRTDLVDLQGGEESWGLLWDERYAGRIGILGNEGDTWWCAAIYAGIPFEEIHTDENVEKVAAMLREQQPLVLAYYDDVTTMEQALASGELVAGMTWNETPARLLAQGVPIRWAAPKEGALTWVCGAAILADAPRVDKAHDVVDALLSPSAGHHWIDAFGYGHSNLKAFNMVSEERLTELGLSRDPNKLLGSGHFQIPSAEEFPSRIANIFADIKAGF
jgi:spermidine/putrescine transport system substrate-binding protein